MTLIEPHTRLFTRDEYYAMADLGLFNEQRVELIEGEILEKAPQKNPHFLTIALVQDALKTAFPAEFWIRPQGPLHFGDRNEPEPDIAVVRGIPRDFQDHPTTALLIVEVSETTLRYDRGRKARLYARFGIADYWIVNLVDRQLEICRKPIQDAAGNWSYSEMRTLAADESIAALAAPQVAIAVSDLLP
ncbi:MAG TPA: Uma2 family endonuclease [Tepidisphaeraceae bacterium]|jgi:Uma2 family endonuclease|nr:Uma2 family endonuclease [Tepidisphaeraceae bacterium]